MEVYSIERDGKIQKQLQPSDSIASSLSTQALVTEHIVNSNAGFGKRRGNSKRPPPPPPLPKSSQSCARKCLYTFLLTALALFVLCFIFMTVLTSRLLFSGEYEKSGANVSLANNGSALQTNVNTNRKLGEHDLPVFNAIEKNFLKFILANITSGLNRTTTTMKRNNGSHLERGSGNNVHTIHADDPYFERNLFSWLKNTFKMAFLGKFDGEHGKTADSTTSPPLPLFPTKFNSFQGDSIFDTNSVPFNKKTFGATECGRTKLFPHILNTRIMHGMEAAPNSWPWAVSIGLDGPREYVPHACGGTLLSKRYVITAAHCVMKNSVYGLVGSPVRNVDKFSKVEKMLRIYAGVHDRLTDISTNRIYGVEKITIHKDFDTTTFKNDLALIRLDRDVDELDGKVSFACLSNQAQVHPGDIIYAIGWGYTEKSRNQASRYLMQVDLTVQHRDNCLIQYIDNDQFCAGNVYKRKDTCNGDSGGPLLKLVNNRWTLVGVVSNGDVSCSGTGIYINTSYYYDWIAANAR